MRSLSLLFASFLLIPTLYAQNPAAPAGWIVDDFSPGDLNSQWVQATGKWTVGERGASVSGASGDLAMLNNKYLMRAKSYTIDVEVQGAGGGAIFCAEKPNNLANSHVVYLSGGALSTGYMDFHGKYVETRVVNFSLPAGAVRLSVYVDPGRLTYTITVEEQNLVLEELRFVSGYAGLFARSAGPKWKRFHVSGEGTPVVPSFYRKSNARQLDHLSHMAILDDALFISNPVIGIVQRLTSIGAFTNEYQVEGPDASPRGIFVEPDRTLYIADAGSKSVKVMSREGHTLRTISAELRDPRAVTVAAGSVYILDVDGIKLYDKKGAFTGAKAAGLFKDPKNIYYSNGRLFVADFGNAKIQVLDAKDFSVKLEITENLVSPWDVATDPSNNDIYVADPGAGVVFHYDQSGNFIERLDPMTIKGFISPRSVRVRGSMIYVGDFERILAFRKGVLTIRPSLQIR